MVGTCAEQATASAQGRVRVVVAAAQPLRPIAADIARLEQVVTNLLSNAIKFAPDGSTVTVTCEESEPDHVRVVVEDEGPGIPPDQLSAIFDRFHQVAHKGAQPRRGSGFGLGLGIVRNLVEMHQGRVWAENRVPRGCRFVVELPARRRDPVVARPVALIARPSSRRPWC